MRSAFQHHGVMPRVHLHQHDGYTAPRISTDGTREVARLRAAS
jgi:hypothetical protein